ncbi:lytic transglycosylase domain-containing protein [candidate division CSSED10-310 bacterium]|uniref:Lytic transglycosylase domain-containing protein n=1 Tax=candidate division CSSED10-310 bacterium TaxID=2855610 RepID=A0ABV6YTK8_UNCC1
MKKYIPLYFLGCFLFVSLMCGDVYAEIYQYYDDKGVLHLTDKAGHPKAKPLKRKAARNYIQQSYHTPQQLKNRYISYVERICREQDMDPLLVRAIIKNESNFNHLAVSPKGALGLMQIIPATARRYGVKNPFDPYSNIEGGIRYLKYLFRLFPDNLSLIVAAYNCGENRVKEYGCIPPITETKLYVKKVLKTYAQYKLDYSKRQQIVKFIDDKGTILLTNRPNASN